MISLFEKKRLLARKRDFPLQKNKNFALTFY